MKFLIFAILVLIILHFVRKFLSRFKFPKIGSLAVFTGAIKSGKSAISLACALSQYKRVHRNWRIRCFFIKLINPLRRKDRKFNIPEEPLFYSNIPLRYIKYSPITLDHLMRRVRFNFGSIVFIDEASLVADSQLIKDGKINTQLLLFFKLFGHSTHGGKCIVNTQQITDLHYSLKRCTSQYFYVHHISKYIPFFTLASIREERYSEDGTDLNVFNDDIENSLKSVFMRKSVFKRYDCFCFSILTDDRPVKNEIVYNTKYDSLKTEKIISFRPEFQNINNIENVENVGR